METIRKKIYLDVCTLCRPFDDQNMIRIRLETNALYLILRYVENGIYEMIRSPVHHKEFESIEDIRERSEIVLMLRRYSSKPVPDMQKIRDRAEYLHNVGFGLADATHVAFAETTSDCFITCDDKLLKKSRKIDISIPTFNPIEFCIKEDLK